MSIRRQITRGVRGLFRRADADEDIRDEVEHFFEEARAHLVGQGMTEREAGRAVRMTLGSPDAAREQVRGYGWESLVGAFAADLKFALRRLRQEPSFTVASVLTLAIGIGASTTMFSAARPMLFDPVPYPQPDRLMSISDVRQEGLALDVTFGTYREFEARSRAFESFAVMRTFRPTMTALDQAPERLDGQHVTHRYFEVVGVAPVLGRTFRAADDQLNGPLVAILSDALWRRRFDADPAIVGREITLNDQRYTVIGVLPADYENVVAPAAEFWAPLQYDASLPATGREWGHHLLMIGRVRAGVDRAHALDDLNAIARNPVHEFNRPAHAALSKGLLITPLSEAITKAVRPALLAVLGAVLVLLVISCVNVTNLLLARGNQRHGEFAVRAALGAGQSRLVRQMITESLVLAFVGGALGLLVAQLGTRALVTLMPPELPRIHAIRIDRTVLVWSAVTTTLIGIAAGLVPAFQLGIRDLFNALRQGSRRTAGGNQRTRSRLVVAEIALALVLLVSAGLLMRSLQRLFAVDPGFDHRNLLTMQVQVAGARYIDNRVAHQFFERAREAVLAVPGITAADWTSQVPLSGEADEYGLTFESDPERRGDASSVFRFAVSRDYFKTMGVPLRRGRAFESADFTGDAVHVIISESLARRQFPNGEDPIGERLHIGRTDLPWYTIVGVVGDIKHASLAAPTVDAVYIPAPQWWAGDRVMSLLVRSSGDVAERTAAIRDAIWSVDKDQAISRVATMEQLVEAAAAERRFALIVLQGFAAIALLLAAIGVYGVLAGSVTERTREIGVRAALGASRRDVLSLVVGDAARLAGFGILIGVIAAVGASRFLQALLFGISPLDPVTHIAVIVILGIVSLLACAIPAWRAAGVHPSIALSAE